MKTALVVGNPKPKSRTLDAGILVATKLAGKPPDTVLDLVMFGPALLEFGNASIAEAIASVRQANVLIVASPTFKATYTGLLKVFLDQFPPDGLAGIISLPVMLGAGPAHALAPELSLKPVLVELGAICPTAGLYLIDKSYDTDPRLDAWIARAKSWLYARAQDPE